MMNQFWLIPVVIAGANHRTLLHLRVGKIKCQNFQFHPKVKLIKKKIFGCSVIQFWTKIIYFKGPTFNTFVYLLDVFFEVWLFIGSHNHYMCNIKDKTSNHWIMSTIICSCSFTLQKFNILKKQIIVLDRKLCFFF